MIWIYIILGISAAVALVGFAASDDEMCALGIGGLIITLVVWMVIAFAFDRVISDNGSSPIDISGECDTKHYKTELKKYKIKSTDFPFQDETKDEFSDRILRYLKAINDKTRAKMKQHNTDAVTPEQEELITEQEQEQDPHLNYKTIPEYKISW